MWLSGWTTCIATLPQSSIEISIGYPPFLLSQFLLGSDDFLNQIIGFSLRALIGLNEYNNYSLHRWLKSAALINHLFHQLFPIYFYYSNLVNSNTLPCFLPFYLPNMLYDWPDQPAKRFMSCSLICCKALSIVPQGHSILIPSLLGERPRKRKELSSLPDV